MGKGSLFLRVWWQRICNRIWHFEARLKGYCDHSPWSPVPGEGSGYMDWRCALLKHNDEQPHRYRNYTWRKDCQVEHNPVKPGMELSPLRRRFWVYTSRQARQYRRFMAQRYIEILQHSRYRN